ncbi:MAG: flavin reductase family protein [Acidimicrobiales bacterium]
MVGRDTGVSAFHELVADLDYPMAIVTTAVGTERAGCLVGFVTQCSIHPPLVMVWLSKENHTTGVVLRAAGLLVHLPSPAERDLATLFGSTTGDDVDKFARCRWQPGPAGLPRLTDCDRWLHGHIVERLDTGDHVGHLLEVIEAAAGPWSGQLGFQALKDLAPGHPA